MWSFRLRVAILLSLFFVSSAQAQKSLLPDVPPGKWKWYFGSFSDVGSFRAPDIFWGEATVTIKGSSIRIEMEEHEAGPDDKPPVFSGTIDTRNQIKGVLDGILLEDPRPTHGHYRKLRWNPGKCVNEVIVLEEDFRAENQLVLRRGTPGGC